jgi:predicted Zn-dependent peptidase
MNRSRSRSLRIRRPSLRSSSAPLAVLLMLFVAGCGGSPPPAPAAPAPAPVAPPAPPAPDETFRQTPPTPGPDPAFVPPQIQEQRLANGVRILFVERHELPVVSFDLAFDRGADQDRPAVGGFTGAMLFQGTKTKSALQLSDAIERLGAHAGGSVDFDASRVHASCLAPKFADTLALVADVVMNPAFAKDEIERERSHRLTAVAQENDRPEAVLRNTVANVLYPKGHPYASSLLGTADALKRITRDDLVRFHKEVFSPDLLTVSVSGDLKLSDVVAQVTQALGGWKGKAARAKEPGTPPAPTAKEPRIILVDRPGATQSRVDLALVGLPRHTKDFDALEVMNVAFGGNFSSRLNMNLREAHAYTYGARSSFDYRHGPGPFLAGGAIVREKTGPAVTEMLKELDRIRNEPISSAELANAKSPLIRGLPAVFETTDDVAWALSNLATYGLPLDEYATRPARFAAVTADDVKRVADTYLVPANVRIVVVGDAKVVAEQLSAVGMGTVTVRAGEPGSAAPGDKPADKKAKENKKAK